MNKCRIGMVHFCRGEWTGMICKCRIDDETNEAQPILENREVYLPRICDSWYPIGEREDWKKWGWEIKGEKKNV